MQALAHLGEELNGINKRFHARALQTHCKFSNKVFSDFMHLLNMQKFKGLHQDCTIPFSRIYRTWSLTFGMIIYLPQRVKRVQ